jgi:hypothetical protein
MSSITRSPDCLVPDGWEERSSELESNRNQQNRNMMRQQGPEAEPTLGSGDWFSFKAQSVEQLAKAEQRRVLDVSTDI